MVVERQCCFLLLHTLAEERLNGNRRNQIPTLQYNLRNVENIMIEGCWGLVVGVCSGLVGLLGGFACWLGGLGSGCCSGC